MLCTSHHSSSCVLYKEVKSDLNTFRHFHISSYQFWTSGFWNCASHCYKLNLSRYGSAKHRHYGLTQNDRAEVKQVSTVQYACTVNDQPILFFCVNQEESGAKVHRPEPLCYTHLSLWESYTLTRSADRLPLSSAGVLQPSKHTLWNWAPLCQQTRLQTLCSWLHLDRPANQKEATRQVAIPRVYGRAGSRGDQVFI